jgi:hypothetical protein
MGWMVEINNCCMHCTPLTFESGYALSFQLNMGIASAISQLNLYTNIFGLQELMHTIKATFTT